MTIKVQHKRSAVKGKVPLPTDLEYGEIAVNYEASNPAFYIKDSAGVIRRIGNQPGALVFKGSRAPTAPAPTAPTAGDVYVMNADGTMAASWIGVAGRAVVKSENIAWDGTGWESLGDAKVPDATETAKGIVELATAAETTTGTDGTRAVHPAGLKVELDKKVKLAGDTMTGNLTVPSLNKGPLAGFRNAIINGNFDHWQRGTSFTGNEYGADRWIHARIGTTHTATRQAFALGQIGVSGEPEFYCRTVVSSVAGAANLSRLEHRCEDVRTFAGQQITASFWAKADAAKPIAVDFSQSFGSGGSPSADVTGIGTTKVTLSTSWQKITITTTVPSVSGKTLGSDGNSYLRIRIWFDAGSSFDSRTDTLGQQSGTFDIAQVQVEPGPVATPFESRPRGTELALCQRYYELYTPGHDTFACSLAAVTGLFRVSGIWRVEKRGTPTISSSAGAAYVPAGARGAIGWSCVLTNGSTQSVRVISADAEL